MRGCTTCCGCPQWLLALALRSNRVGDVHPFVDDPETLGEQLAETPDPEGLGRVVARGEKMHARLAGVRHDVLARLAGEERVQPVGHGLLWRVGPAAGHDADRADGVRAARAD